MPAVILNHPRHEVKLHDPRDPEVSDPYPQTAETIARAKAAQAAERAAIGYEPPTDEQWEKLEAQEGLMNLIRKYGGQRVSTWVKNLTFIVEGQEVS